MTRSLRRTLSLVTLACALALAARPAAAAPAFPALTGTVTWVHDADTFEIAPHGQVRLLGIDAPEKHASERDRTFLRLGSTAQRLRQTHGAGLAWCLRHVKGTQVTLSFDRDRRDRFGRLLAYVRLADGRLLNRLLLDEGLVIVYRRFPFALKAEFLAAEADARQRGVGLWAR